MQRHTHDMLRDCECQLMCCLSCSGNVDGHKDNLAPENYDAFVDYLTEVVGYYRHEMNFTFRTVEPFNEPYAWNWQKGNFQEGCHYDPSTQDIILQVRAVLHSLVVRCFIEHLRTYGSKLLVHICPTMQIVQHACQTYSALLQSYVCQPDMCSAPQMVPS